MDRNASFRVRYAPALHLLLLLLVMLAFYVPLALLPYDVADRWTEEDGPVEYLGAFCFLGASLFFFRVYRAIRAGDATFAARGYFLVLAVGMFFAFGEEISWGQRLIGFETPSTIAEHNRQNEFTVHNLTLFAGRDEAGTRKEGVERLITMGFLFQSFWLVFCVLLPVIARTSRAGLALLHRFRLPLVPLETGLAFLLNYLLSKVMESSSRVGHLNMVNETKEFLAAFLFLVVAVRFWQACKAEMAAAPAIGAVAGVRTQGG